MAEDYDYTDDCIEFGWTPEKAELVRRDKNAFMEELKTNKALQARIMRRFCSGDGELVIIKKGGEETAGENKDGDRD
ncbi:MAG: hypothetical protein Q4F72_10785 [Desulfovibrionaceae bacterium]|nr:hypothetical protein [Desulfovibrionaceae bacterium]